MVEGGTLPAEKLVIKHMKLTEPEVLSMVTDNEVMTQEDFRNIIHIDSSKGAKGDDLDVHLLRFVYFVVLIRLEKSALEVSDRNE